MLDTLFSFKGRINRKPYWIFTLILYTGMIITSIIDFNNTGKEGEIGYVTKIYMVVLIWPALAIQVKRWHDRNKSGWWVLINFVPVIGFIWAIIENGFLPGKESANRFGVNPLKK